jgi:hypothetical protein
MSVDLNEKAVSLLARITAVELKTVQSNNLYTVPAGKKLAVTAVIIRDLAYSAAGTVMTLGKVGATTDWLVAQTLTNAIAGTVCRFISPAVQHATIPTVTPEYVAGNVFCLSVTTGCTAASCPVTVEVYGTLKDA